jgi:hypothetical protein
MAETEVVRRLNEHVQDVPWPFYSRYIKFGIAQGVLAGSSEGARLVLPESMLPWAERRTKQMIASVDGRGYDVAGDLDDLLPPVDGVATGDIPEPDPRILSQAATAAAAYLVREFAKSWQRQSRQERSQQAARGHHWAPAWRRGRDRARLVGLNQIVGLLRRAHRVVRDRVRR